MEEANKKEQVDEGKDMKVVEEQMVTNSTSSSSSNNAPTPSKIITTTDDIQINIEVDSNNNKR